MIVDTVVVVNDFGHVEGGASNVAIKTALALSKAVKTVIFFTGVNPIDSSLQEGNIQVVCTEQYDILHNPKRMEAVCQGIWNLKSKKMFGKLLDSLDKNRTIIHVHTWTKCLSSSIFLIANKYHFKTVVSVHDYFLICPNGGLFNYKKACICTDSPFSLACVLENCDARSYPQKIWRLMRQFIQNQVIYHSDWIYFIFISHFSKEQFLYRRNIKQKCYFLKNPVEIKDRFRIPVEKNDAYLYIGRLSKEKGIECFCKLITESGHRGIVIGDGYIKPELQQKYPNLTFTGWLSPNKMLTYLMQGRALIFPSLWYEVSPLTPLEVMAYGIPCLVPDTCGASESVPNGKAGLLYNGVSYADLKDKFRLLDDDSAIAKMSEYAFGYYSQAADSTSKYLSNLLKIYENILDFKEKRCI